jgi:uncharacterized damage-inducible protein DinB
MEEQVTKAGLLEELRAARAEWDSALAETPPEMMSQKLPGGWTIKDIAAHLTSYDRWFVNASQAHFQGKLPPPDGSEGMSEEERNQFFYEQARDRPLEEVLEESEGVFLRLLEMVAAHEEQFLVTPQEIEGVPEPVRVWEILRGNGYEHYRQHAGDLRGWLKKVKGGDHGG